MDDRLQEKVDLIADHVADLRVTSARMADSLDHHVKRTDLLEERVEQFGRVVQQVKGMGLVAGFMGWLIATAAALLELWRARG